MHGKFLIVAFLAIVAHGTASAQTVADYYAGRTVSILVGSVAMFITLFLLFVKIFPSVSIYEVKETMPSPKAKKDVPL